MEGGVGHLQDGGGQVWELSDLDVDTVGLVFRGANRKPFYVVKSESREDETRVTEAGGTTMSGTEDLIRELESKEEVSLGGWQQMVGLVKDLFSKQAGPEPVEGTVELSSEPSEEGFAEAMAQMRDELAEQFAEQLKAEREKREAITEELAAEKRQRRLEQFNDMAGSFGALAVPKESFGEDLMRIADLDPELYGRVESVLRAADNAVSQGALFEQYASAAPLVDGGDPFEAEVERVRKERFSDLPFAKGQVEAMNAVQDERPELARAYAVKATTVRG